MKVVIDYLKSTFFHNIESIFNKWCRAVSHGNVNFATLNQAVSYIENINCENLNLKQVMANSDVKTCISATNRNIDNSLYEFGSMLDNVELLNQYDFENKGLTPIKSRNSGFFGQS